MIPDSRERKPSFLTTGQTFARPGVIHSTGTYQEYQQPKPDQPRLPIPDLSTLGRKLFQFVKPRKNRERAVFKNGDCNVYYTHIASLSMRYLHDLFTSLVDIKWRWTLMIFCLAYFVSWLFFALIWWLIMFTHGDLEDEHLPQNQAESGWTPCVLNIHNFTSCYLFSIETQYTIGYGVRTTTEECPEAIFIMSVQSIVATTIDAFFIGIVFAKMTRPKLRTQTLLFSRNAVVCVHEGALCLMFRVGDMRKNPLIGAAIRAQLVKAKRTREGEVMRNYRTELELTVDGCGNDIFFLWPLTITHKIDEDSPLYNLSARDMLQSKIEIVVVLEGTVESTGQSIQARSSYVSSEILWGYKFEHIVDHLKKEDAYHVNYSKFDNIYPVDTPLCSAAEFEEFNQMEDNVSPGAPEAVEETSEEDFTKPKFRIGGDSPLLTRSLQNQYSNARISSLARISTCNSSLTHVPSALRYGSSRKSFRPGATRKIRRRAVFKNGECNILQSRISRRGIRFLQDIFTTLVDIQWRWTLIIFALAFFVSWLGFALIWWLIMFTHGDLEDEHLPMNQAESGWTPCVLNIHSFTSCYLFSIETQHTIGYGVRTTTEECPEAIFIMSMQSIAGMMIQAFMVGIVFAKMTRPKLRTQTLLFSRNAVICQREGYLCLMFRVGDMRKSHIIGATIRAQLIRSRKTKEGEVVSNYQTELNVSADGCDGNLFFIWPMTIVHRIDEESPLYHLSASDMLQDKFEVVVILEGTVESTGQTTQARSSYLASEVLWGHRFEPVVAYNKDRQGYEVNYSKFDNTYPVDTPLCSGAELAEFYKLQDVPDCGDSDPATTNTN